MLPSHWRQAFTCKYVREKPEMGVRVICKYVNYVASSPITQRLSVPGSMLIHNDGIVAFQIQAISTCLFALFVRCQEHRQEPPHRHPSFFSIGSDYCGPLLFVLDGA
ncbi:hypothetical protein BDR04DRAFT_130401 [Suillus decipiens]|nr:hypothetical protein BDR04DRAFT_130401 [Suillus decipiens]